jgi:Domain of unknown function (DUF1905)/Bacteriocin-protection, YdeI or OmpD-Associated
MNDYHVFSGKIYKLGMIRYVDVPKDVSRAIGNRATHVAVQGEVQGVPLRTTLVSRGRGCYRVALHSDIRNKLKVDAGAYVEIAIERDEEPREPVLPPALVLALRQSPKAQTQFRSMTTALRRQIVRYLTSVKLPTTLERRVGKFVSRLEQRNREQAKKKTKK